MNDEMAERFRALADFMEWIDPAGYAAVLADATRTVGQLVGEDERPIYHRGSQS